jgi:CBS domain-containing protein
MTTKMRPSPKKAKVRARPARAAATHRRRAERPAPSRWERLTAGDVMRREVVTIDRGTPLAEVERILDDQRISGAPVTDGSGTIVGVVSLRDLVERYGREPGPYPRRAPAFYDLVSDETLEEDLDRLETPPEAEETAADVMTGEIYAVPEGADLRAVARAMTKHRVHRLLVERAGRYVGLVSTLEILEALAK